MRRTKKGLLTLIDHDMLYSLCINTFTSLVLRLSIQWKIEKNKTQTTTQTEMKQKRTQIIKHIQPIRNMINTILFRNTTCHCS